MEDNKKRDQLSLADRDYDAVLLDIEGTTTPITFVKNILFPYAKENVRDYLEEHWTTEQCQQDVQMLREQAKIDCNEDGAISIPDENSEETTREEVISAVTDNVLWQIEMDHKTTALKQLQGHIWKQGYDDGKLKGEVYEDVLPALKHWTAQGTKVFIYSSGSVQAQKLLFGHSNYGDLLKFFSGHFDTKVGPKVESESYEEISALTGHEVSRILFVTDIPKEARAAAKAGMQVVVSVRPGNADLSEEDRKTFHTITSFAQITMDGSENNECKPKKLKAGEP